VVSQIKRPKSSWQGKSKTVGLIAITLLAIYTPFVLNQNGSEMIESQEIILPIDAAPTITGFPITKGERVAHVTTPGITFRETNEKILWKLIPTGMEYIADIDFDTSGRFFVVGGNDGERGLLYIVRQDSGEVLYAHIDEAGPVVSVAISDDGNRVVYGTDSAYGETCQMAAIDTTDMSVFWTYDFARSAIEEEGLGAISDLSLSSDGRYAAAAYNDTDGDEYGEVALVDLDKPGKTWENVMIGDAQHVSLSDDGMVMAAASTNEVWAWNMTPHAKLPNWDVMMDENITIHDMALSGDGQALVIGAGRDNATAPGFISFYSLVEEEEWQLEMPAGDIIMVWLSEDGRYLYSENMNGKRFGHDTVQQTKFYDSEWDWVQRAEFVVWKQEHMDEAVANAATAPPPDPLIDYEPYIPVFHFGLLLTGCIAFLYFTRRYSIRREP
tara:strand:- start:41 stop:1363 length:1323 start_codon:yes stop_codon:yes gene_type:complete